MDEAKRLKNFVPGTTVTIQRTDGRIHNALISLVNHEQDSITVEWFEDGETKGKELEVSQILNLNPHLADKKMLKKDRNVQSNLPIRVSTKDRQTLTGNLTVTNLDSKFKDSRDTQFYISKSPREDLEYIDEIEDKLFEPSPRNLDTPVTFERPARSRWEKKQTSPKSDVYPNLNLPTDEIALTSNQSVTSRRKFGNDSKCSSHSSARGEPKERDFRASKDVQVKPLLYSRETNTSNINKRSKLIETSSLEDRFSTAPNTSRKSRLSTIQNRSPQESKTFTATNYKKGRLSNVVKEVEKLKKKREERRHRQAEEKAEKEAFMNKAPGNPHWELLKMINEYRSTLDFKPISIDDPVENHQITVCVRKRPMSKVELNKKEVDVISVPTKNMVIVHEPKNKVDLTKYLENQNFRFDYVFDDTCTNELVYKYTAQPLVQTIFEGHMATCFAYGQTGSGKTHTMGGNFCGKIQDCNKGIYAMVTKDVFKYKDSPEYQHLQLVVAASFFEIYSGKVFDLLNKKARLRMLEDGKQQIQVVGLTEKVVFSIDDVIKIIQIGNSCRTSGQTSSNTNSSRSHAVFQLTLRKPGLTKVHGKFSLIDLAGNERGSDTSSSDRGTRMEGAEINKSLLALKECIRALGNKDAQHHPFRASKLTQILRDSFIGDKSKTCMIAMISPNVCSCEHTLNTLRYADRVKELAVENVKPDLDQDIDFGEKSDNDNEDLNLVRKDDLPVETLNHHNVVTALITSEEAMVENHKNLLGFLEKFISKSKTLYTRASEVDYDEDAYSQEWEEMLKTAIEKFQISTDLVRDFRKKLTVEEQLSKNLKDIRTDKKKLRVSMHVM